METVVTELHPLQDFAREIAWRSAIDADLMCDAIADPDVALLSENDRLYAQNIRDTRVEFARTASQLQVVIGKLAEIQSLARNSNPEVLATELSDLLDDPNLLAAFRKARNDGRDLRPIAR